MLELVLTFSETNIADPRAQVDFFWNVDEAGNAGGDVNEAEPINDAPIDLFRAVGAGPQWGETPWGTGPWGGQPLTLTARFDTPPVHFGRVKAAAKARDRLGNVQSGGIVVAERTINSTPRAVRRFQRGDWDGETSRQWFAFEPPAQLAA